MNNKTALIAFGLFVGAVFLSWNMGYKSGRQDCPEYARQTEKQSAQSAEFDRQLVEAISGHVSDREKACDDFFTAAQKAMREERLAEEEERQTGGLLRN